MEDRLDAGRTQALGDTTGTFRQRRLVQDDGTGGARDGLGDMTGEVTPDDDVIGIVGGNVDATDVGHVRLLD